MSRNEVGLRIKSFLKSKKVTQEDEFIKMGIKDKIVQVLDKK